MMAKNHKYPYYEHDIINNLHELLKLRLDKTPDHIAFSFKKENEIIKKTYKELYNDATLMSNYFYKHYKNKHIALIGENSYNWIITFLGIVLSGNICVVLDKDSDKELITKLMKYTNTDIFYYSKSYCNFIKDLKYKKNTIDDIDIYLELGKNSINKYKINDEKDAVIFFTSGTTGPNKGVLLSQKNMARDIYGASSLYTHNGKVVSFLPFHHSFGLVTSILMPIYYDAEVYINSSLKDLLDDFKRVKPYTIFVVPAFIETFYKQIWRTARKDHKEKILKWAIRTNRTLMQVGLNAKNMFFKKINAEFGGNLHYIICGGAKLDTKYIKWFRTIGINILNGYGITECSPVVAVNRNNHYRDGSVGQIVRDVKIKIIDNEICIKGPIVMNGYYKDKNATKGVIIDGYFHTGDLGYLDKDNFLFIKGRKKNIIVLSNGENISPESIESELLKNDAINEVIVYEDDNKLVAYIYPSEDYLGDTDYFDNLIYEYNKNKPKNHQIAFVKLRTKEFKKNNNRKILRDRIMEE
jgi:long-chain acyl-CoA synthetase